MKTHALITEPGDVRLACECGESIHRGPGSSDKFWAQMKVGFIKNHYPWLDDETQFARLLSEIMAVCALTERQWGELLISMDLTSDELSSLFDRAQESWERAKERTREMDRQGTS